MSTKMKQAARTQLRLGAFRKGQARQALLLANAVYQEVRGEKLEGRAAEQRFLLEQAVGALEMFCLATGSTDKTAAYIRLVERRRSQGAAKL